MRILHIVSSIDPADGGTSAVAIRLAAAHAGLGHEVHLLSYLVSEAQSRIDQSVARVPDFHLVNLHLLPGKSPLESLLGFNARSRLNELMPHLDWVHLHGTWEMVLKAGADIAHRHDVGYCFRPAGMLDPWCLKQKHLKKKIALGMGYRRALENSSFIHVLSQDEEKSLELLNLGVPNFVLANGVFMEEMTPLPSPGTFYKAHPELGDRPYLLFLARKHHKKGLDYLADAFALLTAKLPEVELVVAGPDGGAEKPFINQIEKAGLRSRVHLIGPLYGDDKLAAMVDSALFCLPTRQEGFSVAVLEALACGTPVVISHECHFPQVAASGAGMIVPLQPVAIAAALEKILSDPQSKHRMGHAARDLIMNHHLWTDIAKKSVCAYQRAIAVRKSIPELSLVGM